jgi:DNA repair photolyase
MVKEIIVKSILNKHKKRDPWFLDDYSLNPYQLCEFNCVYCYIRGSKYGENMKNKLAVKVNAPSLLEKELLKRARNKEYGFIALSSATEPWMYIEEKYKITRKCLEIIARFKFPVHCMTKSPLILRDLDILKEIDKNAILPYDLEKLNRGTLITFSFSTLDENLRKIFEPNAPTIKKRLDAVKNLKDEGFKVGIAFIPLLPFISDSEEQIEEMVKIANEINVDYVFFGDLSLYGVGKEIYFKVLEKYFPDLIEKYRELYKGVSPKKEYKNRLYNTSKKLCKKYGVKWGII